MSRRIKRYLAVLMTIAIVVSGMNDFSFITRADSILNETTMYSEVSSLEYAETEETIETGTVEGLTDAKDTVETETVQEKDTTVKNEETEEAEEAVVQIADEEVEQIADTPEAVGRHEAENADTFNQDGNTYSDYTFSESDAFSGGKAVGNLNEWPNNGRKYLTYSVNASMEGEYKLTIAYAGDDNTAHKECNIDVRVNNSSDWIQIPATSTGSWNSVSTVETTVVLKAGTNTIDITGVSYVWYDDTTSCVQWMNVDYFELEYKGAVAAEGRHEAENAAAFTSGHNIQENSAYSNGKAVGNLNAWPDDGRAYFTYYLNADRAGTYKMTIAYAADNDSTEKKDCNIEVCVNNTGTDDSHWSQVAAPMTGSWETVKTVTTTVKLNKGVNTVKITGASNVWYGEPHNWQWANIDYFEIADAPMAEGKHEAEEAKSYTQGSASGAANIQGENGGFSNGYAVGGMNAWPNDGRAYLTYPVYAEHPGEYNIEIGYASDNCYGSNIDIAVNSTDSSSWQSVAIPMNTEHWAWIERVSTTITLKKGINNIHITGASYVNDGSQWVNIDYFTITRIKDETNIALDKPVTVSSDRGDTAQDAVDGYSESRWGGKGNQSENWMMIDLEGMYEIESVNIFFEQAYPKNFEILISRDGKNWITARTVKDWTPSGTINGSAKLEWKSDSICLGKAAYIKINATKLNNNDWGLSIWEFEVRGKKVAADLSDVAVSKEVTVSSSNEYKAENAVDGKDDTRWGSAKGATQWYQINLGSEHELHSIDLKFERAYAQNFKLQVSSDGKAWTDAYTKSGWKEPGNPKDLSSDKKIGYSFHLDSVKATYVKLEVTGLDADGCWNGLSIYEFEVWGKDVSKSDYWNIQKSKKYGIYPVKGLQKTEIDGTAMKDSSLVQGDVLGTDDTYEVVYEANKSIYFYINPYNYLINYDNDILCWSSQSSGVGLWGADHNESIAKYGGQTDATVKYVLPSGIDFGDKDYVTTEVGCQIWKKTNLENGTPKDGTSPEFSIKIKLKVLKSHDIYIEDTIPTNGCLTVRNPESGATYIWQRSDDGQNDWQDVNEKRYDLQVVMKNGQYVNVAKDLGGGKYYRVKKEGATEWSQPYHVPYYNDVRNGNFEYPAMFAPGSGETFAFDSQLGDEQQYPNGYSGLMWKTTGPGWTNEYNGVRVGHDIEIVNARYLRVNEDYQVNQFSVTLDQMYKNNANGDQFAELNCENIGSLYQDIITTPDSECYWELDHAGRWNQNTMYVVAMSAKDAKNYETKDEIDELISKSSASISQDTKEGYFEGDEVDLGDGAKATVWKVTSPAKAGEWEHHSGKYSVPKEDNQSGSEVEEDKNYLTRFFFVSVEGGKRKRGDTPNNTVGNLLDNITFEMKKSYTAKYYIDDETNEKHTVTGIVEPYQRIYVPDSIDNYDLSKYTLYRVELNGTRYYLDEATRLMTVAYAHDDLALYYKSSTIAVTKKVVGLAEIPDGYQLRFDLMKGGTSIANQTVSKDDFTLIEKVNETDEDSYFVTIEFDGTSLGLSDNDSCSIKETLVPLIENSSYYLSQVETNDNTYALNAEDVNKSEVSYSYDFTYYTQQANSITFTNTYKPTRKLTVSKNVEGNIGNLTKKFDFTLALKQGENNVDIISSNNESAEVSKSSTGNYSFKLKHNESVTFTIMDSCIATVKEGDYSSDGYTTTWSVSDIGTSSITTGGNGFTTTDVIDKDITAAFVNTKVAPAATGLFNSVRPFIMLIGCALLLLAFVLGKKGKFYNNMKGTI